MASLLTLFNAPGMIRETRFIVVLIENDKNETNRLFFLRNATRRTTIRREKKREERKNQIDGRGSTMNHQHPFLSAALLSTR